MLNLTDRVVPLRPPAGARVAAVLSSVVMAGCVLSACGSSSSTGAKSTSSTTTTASSTTTGTSPTTTASSLTTATSSTTTAVAHPAANGEWLSTSSDSPSFATLANLADVRKLLASLTPSGTLTLGAPTTFHGQPALRLNDSGDRRGAVYVASTGQPYILGVTGSGSDAGQLLFTGYGTAELPAAPAGAIDITQLGHAGSG